MALKPGQGRVSSLTDRKMNRLLILLVLVFLTGNVFSQIPLGSPFDVTAPRPIDNRDTLTFLADTTNQTTPSPGHLVWVNDVQQHWYYNNVTGNWYQINISGTTAAATAKDTMDVILTGQSNAVGFDNTIGTWTYTLDSNIYVMPYDGNTWEVANPATNFLPEDPDRGGVTRNNLAWQFALEYRRRHPNSVVRIVMSALGSNDIPRWTPATNPGGGASYEYADNTQLDSLINKLDRLPTGFNARVVLFPQGEADFRSGVNQQREDYLNNLFAVYDTVKAHNKVSDDLIWIWNHPVNIVANFTQVELDSFKIAQDSITYQKKFLGGRNITTAFTDSDMNPEESEDNIHFNNEEFVQLGKATYQAYDNYPFFRDRRIEGEVWIEMFGEAQPVARTNRALYIGPEAAPNFELGFNTMAKMESFLVGNDGGALFGIQDYGGFFQLRDETGVPGATWRARERTGGDREQLTLSHGGILMGGPLENARYGEFTDHVFIGPNAFSDWGETLTWVANGGTGGTPSRSSIRIDTFSNGSLFMQGRDETGANSYTLRSRPDAGELLELFIGGINVQGGFDIVAETGKLGAGIQHPTEELHVVGEAIITGNGGNATTLTGRDASEMVTDVTVGSGLQLASGTLTANSVPGTEVDLTDAGGYFTGTETEAVTQELGSKTQYLTASADMTTIDHILRIDPITSATAALISGLDGMVIYVSDTNGTFTSVGIWAYENGSWVKL